MIMDSGDGVDDGNCHDGYDCRKDGDWMRIG